MTAHRFWAAVAKLACRHAEWRVMSLTTQGSLQLELQVARALPLKADAGLRQQGLLLGCLQAPL